MVDSDRFALKSAGVRYLGPAKYKGEYMLLRREAFPAIDDTPYFLYQPGSSVEAEAGMLKSDRAGYIVYEDEFQVVAQPFADTAR